MSVSLLSAARTVLFIGVGLIMATAARAQDLRTWTDSTGRFTLSAKFVALQDGQVTLAREDGSKMTIALEKLSKADQEYVEKTQSENPFQPAEDSPFRPADDSPFTRVEPGSGTSVGRAHEALQERMERFRAGATRGASRARPNESTVDWSRSSPVALDAAGAEWKLAPPAPSSLGFRPRTTALPAKTDFFEKLTGVAVNPVAKKAVVGFTLARHRSEGTSRIVFCDIERGRTLRSGESPGQMMPLALHDDGEHVLMRRNEFGFGNLDRLEIWSLEGKEVVRSRVWTPYETGTGGPEDVLWAEFVDRSTLATGSRGGRVALWDIASMEPSCHLQLVNGAVPGLSPDRKWIAFCSADRVGVFDVEKQEVIAVQETPTNLTWPQVAFSPSGSKIGCVANDRILVWDTATGQLEKNFTTPGIHINGAIDFPDDGFILAKNEFLIALDTQLKLWQYQGIEHVRTVGGATFVGVSGFNAPGALLATRLPHSQAQSLLYKAMKQPDLFVFSEGTPVKLSVSAIRDPHRQRVMDALTKKLQAMKCPIQPNAAVEVVASVEGPKEKEISYMFTGDYKVQEYRTRVKFLYQGKPIWETSGTNIPMVLTLRDGENVAGVLKKASAQPSYGWFDGVVLPEFLQKPADGRGAGRGQTLGACRVTPTGNAVKYF
jgi:hypothetical protein